MILHGNFVQSFCQLHLLTASSFQHGKSYDKKESFLSLFGCCRMKNYTYSFPTLHFFKPVLVHVSVVIAAFLSTYYFLLPFLLVFFLTLQRLGWELQTRDGLKYSYYFLAFLLPPFITLRYLKSVW